MPDRDLRRMQRLSQSPREAGFVQDPYPFYDRARAAGPLFFWEDYGFPCAAGYDAVNAILRDRRLGREPPEEMKPARPAHLAAFYAVDDLSMLDREPPAHTRLRGLVLRAFTSRRIAALEPEIAAVATGLVDRFEGPEVDLIPTFAELLPVIGSRACSACRRRWRGSFCAGRTTWWPCTRRGAIARSRSGRTALPANSRPSCAPMSRRGGRGRGMISSAS